MGIRLVPVGVLAALAALVGCSAPSCRRDSGAQRDAARDGRATAESPGAMACDEIRVGADPWRDDGGPYALGDRGRILGCTHVMSASRQTLEAYPFARADLGSLRSGNELFQVRYVTEIRPGVAGPASALFYLPRDAAGPLPIVIVEHGTTGMGPACAPSRAHETVDVLAVPFVARGYAVVAPDYVGLGVETGMSSYLVGEREAASSLDALRALRRFQERRFDVAALGDEVAIVGYSQGGHAALFTHRAFREGRDGRLLGSVAFAPGLGDVRTWREYFADPNRTTDGMSLFAAMMLFAHAEEHETPAVASWLSPRAREMLPRLFHDHCLATLGLVFRETFPSQGNVYQAPFQEAAKACSLDGPCPGFEPWSTRLVAEQPGDFASDAPALLLAGASDDAVSEASVACIVERLHRRGTRASACRYEGTTHAGILLRAFGDALQWVEARRRGETPARCEDVLVAACPP